ncbi:MAG TPA: hypothetical protein P5150_06635, partial [Candidatus Ratteibacteria bacterium]|nr:hypothetical protein [Candidatus Ratteibacteria bacterium]
FKGVILTPMLVGTARPYLQFSFNFIFASILILFNFEIIIYFNINGKLNSLTIERNRIKL